MQKRKRTLMNAKQWKTQTKQCYYSTKNKLIKLNNFISKKIYMKYINKKL